VTSRGHRSAVRLLREGRTRRITAASVLERIRDPVTGCEECGLPELDWWGQPTHLELPEGGWLVTVSAFGSEGSALIAGHPFRPRTQKLARSEPSR
jgi:hypothetical protein